MARRIEAVVLCEKSGTIRRACEEVGIKVWSVDLLPSDDGSKRHIIGDALDYLEEGWDLIIAHPPCTRLCNSGSRWLIEPPRALNKKIYSVDECRRYQKLSRDRKLAFMWRKLDEAAEFFSMIWNAPVDRIAVENSIMHKHAKDRILNYTKAQTVQPWWFGDPYFKGTHLMLKGLPPLEPTNKLIPPRIGTDEYKQWSFIHRMGPRSGSRSGDRAKTFPGMARAIASQFVLRTWMELNGQEDQDEKRRSAV